MYITTLLVLARTYTASGIVMAAASTAAISAIFYYSRSKEVLWKSLSHLKNPIAAGIQFAVAGIVLAGLIGLSPYSSAVFTVGVLLIGVFAGFVFNIYWNI